MIRYDCVSDLTPYSISFTSLNRNVVAQFINAVISALLDATIRSHAVWLWIGELHTLCASRRLPELQDPDASSSNDMYLRPLINEDGDDLLLPPASMMVESDSRNSSAFACDQTLYCILMERMQTFIDTDVGRIEHDVIGAILDLLLECAASHRLPGLYSALLTTVYSP